mgnify:CR=1 FL=1
MEALLDERLGKPVVNQGENELHHHLPNDEITKHYNSETM